MLPFQRTFISSYPKATQDTQPHITATTSYCRILLYLMMVFCLDNSGFLNYGFVFGRQQRVVPGRYMKLLRTRELARKYILLEY